MQYLYNLDSLVDRYDGFLFDAYGVLYDGKGLIEPCVAAWQKLRDQGKPTWILTNGSSRTIDETVTMYRRLGLQLTPSDIINSASLLLGYYTERGLIGNRTAVLGTKSSAAYVEEAGGIVVNPLETDDYSVVIMANQTDYPLLESLEAVLSAVVTRVEGGLPIQLVLTNPDLIYPHQTRRFGITAGSFALLLEAALVARLGPNAPKFEKLGKPFPRIFNDAIKRAGSKNLLMVGDQLETDIRGAQNSGLDSILVGTGMIRVDLWKPTPDDPVPTYVLPEWR
ncbi:MAG: haloacid dehalogenase [Proteobacteria bacterium]|nr:MAG: haloacid dehalogenase [Pseudomonadota bacterium]